MGKVSLSLSGDERRALFRATQFARDGIHGLGEDYEYELLLNQLDDGGFWNPCVLKLHNGERAKRIVDYILNIGQNACQRYQHDLMMIQDRLRYINDREATVKDHNKLAVCAESGYYGPNWTQQRKKAMQDAEFRCEDCGLDQDTHLRMFDQGLHAHHIVPKQEFFSFSEANAVDNLAILCRDCHNKREYGVNSCA